MANEEHLKLLKQGAESWNEWRRLNPNMQQPDLSGIDLSEFDFRKINLGGVNFKETNITRADLSRVNIPEADLSYANLSFTSLLQADFLRANLSKANLTGSNAHGANFRNANFQETHLRGVGLGETDLRGCRLQEANLTGANLTGANLTGANLSHADLSDAQLGYVNLGGANLGGVDFSRVLLMNTVFSENDLTVVKGLDTLIHYGPSIVNVNTVKLPHGEVLKNFLRGIGFSDTFIEYLPSLLQSSFQYRSVFISYSSKDSTFARLVHSALQNKGVRCWFAPEDMKIGDRVRVRIDEAIHLQDKLLLLLSEHALASDWVEVEVEAALEKEQVQGRDVLFPVRLDESIMQATQAWAKQLRRSRHIGDFTNWADPQAYEQAFERLLRDLKA